MIRNFAFFTVITAIMSSGGSAQTLTPEEILAQVESRVAAQNPYATLLNDPDPARSLAAMHVMLESGDPDLIRMATEFGLLSPNSQVSKAAIRGILSSGPNLTVKLDGSQVEDYDYKDFVRGYLGGTVDLSGFGYVNIPVGEWDEANSCFLSRDQGGCVVTITSEGYIISGRDNFMKGFVTPNSEGQFVGDFSVEQVDESVPGSIELLN